ncbi:MAG: hypothetical protein ABIR39_21445 [Nocardioides sp.]|uniref:hypothetical protein n=1 Tax=Nocardioides sp. TaxID=35761 RepID=UPI003263C168
MRFLPLAGLALLLAGCSSTSTELQTTGVDVERAFNASRDPWAAPTGLTFPSQEYGGANVLRDAGSRSTEYPGLAPAKVARLEIAAALESGWTLASVACAEDPRYTAVLTKGEDLDDSVLAELTVEGPAAGVSLQVPHHLDGSWPSTTPVALDETCLAAGQLNEPPTDLPFDPYPGDGASPSLDDFDPWQRDSLSDEENALMEQILADPLLAAAGAGINVTELGLRTGDTWRAALTGGASVEVQAASTRAAVSQVVEDSDWVLTWAACGAGRQTEATLRIPVEGGTITARLTSTRRDTVEVSLGLPVPEAPLTYAQIEDVPALESSRCLGSEPLGSKVLLEGIPVALPNRLHPYLGQ